MAVEKPALKFFLQTSGTKIQLIELFHNYYCFAPTDG